MIKPSNILIHHFDASKSCRLDDDGDVMNGFYYQFTDTLDMPVGGLIGPYGHGPAAEKAALAALNSNDF